jgi:hypothetical protein
MSMWSSTLLLIVCGLTYWLGGTVLYVKGVVYAVCIVAYTVRNVRRYDSVASRSGLVLIYDRSTTLTSITHLGMAILCHNMRFRQTNGAWREGTAKHLAAEAMHRCQNPWHPHCALAI